MKSYLIYRYGWNEHNQSLCWKAAMAIVDAADAERAKAIAAEHLTIYDNQYLEAVEEVFADTDDWNAVVFLSKELRDQGDEGRVFSD